MRTIPQRATSWLVPLLLISGFIAGVGGLAPAASAASSIDEFSGLAGGPEGITVGPDGNIWFTEPGADKVGKITPSGTGVKEYSVPSPDHPLPAFITAGPDGNLWFTEENASKIAKITPSGTISEFALAAGRSPAGITLGPDGNLWFTEQNADKIGKITTSGTVTEYDLPTSGSYPNLITAGPDGNLWFTELHSDRIGKIVPSGSAAGTITEYSLASGSSPVGITAGPDGNVWFAEAGSNKIGTITPSGVITEYPIPTPSSQTGFIASGPDGNLWFTEQSVSGNNVGRITPSGVITEYPIPTSNVGALGITAGPSGSGTVWFAEQNAKQIGRLSVSLFQSNLIVNGDAEAGAASADGNAVPVPGWDLHGTNFAVVAYDTSSGGIVFPPSSGGPPDHGAKLFTGGIHDGNIGSSACGTNSADVSCATQTVYVSSGAATIDTGGATFDLSGWLGGFGAQADNAVLTAKFMSGGATPSLLGTAQIGPVTAADRDDGNPDTLDTKLLSRSTSGTIPVGTRRIDLRLDMTWAATGYNDGYADSLSLVLHEPPHSGITDMALTVAPGDDITGPGVSKAALGNIPLTDVPESVPPDPSDAPVGKSPVGKSPVGKSPVGKSPVGKSPVGKSPVGKSPVGKSPVGKSPVGKSPVGKSPVGKSPLASFILLRPGGWPAILAHTANLTAATPQSVTWNDLLNDPYATDTDPCTLPELRSSSAPLTCSGATAPDPLTLDQIVWSTSPIADLSFLSLLMGSVTWSDVTPPTGPPTGWCAEWDQTGHPCASSADLGQTIFESEANGLPSYLTSLPTKHVSDIADPTKTLFWGVTLIDLNINGSFLKNVKIADIPAANRDRVVKCGPSGPMNCSDTSIQTLGDAYGNPPPADLTTSALRDGGTFADLGQGILGPRSLTAIEIAFLDPRSISWEDTPLLRIPWETFDENDPTHFITYNLDFDVDCRDSANLQASVHLPKDFRYRPGSSSIAGDGIEGSPNIEPTRDPESGDLVWDLSGQGCSGAVVVHRSVSFEAMPGFNKGTFTSDASVASDSASANVNNTAPVTVHSSFTGNDSPGTAAGVPTNSLLVVHPSTSPQYFTFAVTAGDEVQVSLSHQLHDGDVVLYAPSGTSSEPVLSANPPQPISFGKNPLDDPASNDATTVLPPESLQDVSIVSGLPVAGISNFRGTETDAVTATATKTGMYTLQIDWFNRDVGPEPAVATIRSFPPADLPQCESRSLAITGVQATSTPAIGAGVNTLLLFDQKRTGDMFGATQANNIKSSLQSLVASSSIPGVNAQIVYLDFFSGVNAAFSTADSNPCSPANNNNVVKAINDAVASLGTPSNNNLADIRNVVIVGDEYLIPHAALNDETFDGNERDFTGDTFFKDKTNDLGGTFAGGYFFSDAPYGTRTPLSVLGKIVYLPQWAVGRLAGNGQTIQSAIDNFVASNGLADPRSTTTEPRMALETDYDGFSDGGLLAFTELQSQVGTGNATRLTGSWTRNDFAGSLFKQNAGVSDPPDIVGQNGHHDQYRMLPGAFDNTNPTASNLFTTADISSGPSMSERVFFSLGCHFALDFPAQLGTTANDPRLNYWAKAYFEKGAAVLVGNLGYGYFDTKTTAFDERLLGDFVDNFTKYPTTGEALRQAEVKYFTTMGSFTPYDRKVIQEAIMWGFPMTRLPGAPSTGPAAPTPVSLGTDPVSGVPSTSITVTPALTKTTLGDGSQFYQADDGTQATHPYPILPLVSKVLPLSSSGRIAKGAVPLSLTYSDDSPFKAAFANATVDSSTIESAPASEVGGYPSTLASIGTSLGPDGTFGQRLNVTPGVFRPTDSTADSPDNGLFRKITNSTWLVTYGSPAGSTVGPTISSTQAFQIGTNTAFTANVTHPDGVARVFVQAFRPGGVVDRVELKNSGGDTWTGGTTGTNIFEYWLFALSNAGTSSSSTNKAIGYVPQPPPPPTANVTITPSTPDGQNGWYVNPPSASVPGGYKISVDGGSPQASPVTVSGNGIHTVDAIAPDGSIAGSKVVPVDTSNPSLSKSIGDPKFTSGSTTYVNSSTPLITAIDSGSGLATCKMMVKNSSNKTVAMLDCKTTVTLPSSLPDGTYTISASASDIAGHSSSLPAFRVVLDNTKPAITITRPTATTYSLNQAVTASYSCTDGGSGVATCTGTRANGQNIDTSTVGAKTFTVNSTDKVTNASTKSVTYFVGYNVCLLYDPTQPFRLTTSTIPLKLELCDSNGVNRSSSNITLTAVDLQQFDATLPNCTNSVTDDRCWRTIAPPNLSTNAGDGFVFRFSTALATGGGYIYNYSIKGLVANRTYRLRFMVGSEATGTALHSTQFSTK
jgi:streptogramin lyase